MQITYIHFDKTTHPVEYLGGYGRVEAQCSEILWNGVRMVVKNSQLSQFVSLTKVLNPDE